MTLKGRPQDGTPQDCQELPKKGTANSKFPAGFWTSFNEWWKQQYHEATARPPSRKIAEWYQENAEEVWGLQIPALSDVQRHANCMKPPGAAACKERSSRPQQASPKGKSTPRSRRASSGSPDGDSDGGQVFSNRDSHNGMWQADTDGPARHSRPYRKRDSATCLNEYGQAQTVSDSGSPNADSAGSLLPRPMFQDFYPYASSSPQLHLSVNGVPPLRPVAVRPRARRSSMPQLEYLSEMQVAMATAASPTYQPTVASARSSQPTLSLTEESAGESLTPSKRARGGCDRIISHNGDTRQEAHQPEPVTSRALLRQLSSPAHLRHGLPRTSITSLVPSQQDGLAMLPMYDEGSHIAQAKDACAAGTGALAKRCSTVDAAMGSAPVEARYPGIAAAAELPMPSSLLKVDEVESEPPSSPVLLPHAEAYSHPAMSLGLVPTPMPVSMNLRDSRIMQSHTLQSSVQAEAAAAFAPLPYAGDQSALCMHSDLAAASGFGARLPELLGGDHACRQDAVTAVQQCLPASMPAAPLTPLTSSLAHPASMPRMCAVTDEGSDRPFYVADAQMQGSPLPALGACAMDTADSLGLADTLLAEFCLYAEEDHGMDPASLLLAEGFDALASREGSVMLPLATAAEGQAAADIATSMAAMAFNSGMALSCGAQGPAVSACPSVMAGPMSPQMQPAHGVTAPGTHSSMVPSGGRQVDMLMQQPYSQLGPFATPGYAASPYFHLLCPGHVPTGVEGGGAAGRLQGPLLQAVMPPCLPGVGSAGSCASTPLTDTHMQRAPAAPFPLASSLSRALSDFFPALDPTHLW